MEKNLSNLLLFSLYLLLLPFKQINMHFLVIILFENQNNNK